MTATISPPPTPQSPPKPTYRRVDFPAPVARRFPHVRRLLGGLPLGAAPLGFLATFVTLMTYVPGCAGDDVTSSTTVTGREVLMGRADDFRAAPAPVQEGLHAAAPWALAALIACLVFAVLVIVVPRRFPTVAVVGGVVVFGLLGRTEAQLGSGHFVHTQSELGENVIWLAATLTVIAGLAMHRWHDRPVTPWARCAGFWRRLLAFAIDLMLLMLVTSIIAIAYAPAAAWLGLLLVLTYWPAWEASRYRATPGKQAIGIVVAGQDGAPISPLRCAARHALRLVSIVTLIGAALAGWTERAQALHDVACHTVVVRGIEPDA